MSEQNKIACDQYGRPYAIPSFLGTGLFSDEQLSQKIEEKVDSFVSCRAHDFYFKTPFRSFWSGTLAVILCVSGSVSLALSLVSFFIFDQTSNPQLNPPSDPSLGLLVWFLYFLVCSAAGCLFSHRSQQKERFSFFAWRTKVLDRYNVQEIQNAIAMGNWEHPKLVDISGLSPGALRPLSNPEIEELDQKVCASCAPQALNLWKEYLALPGSIRQREKTIMEKTIEVAKKNIEGSAQTVRSVLLQKHQESADLVVTTQDQSVPSADVDVVLGALYPNGIGGVAIKTA